MDTYGDFARIYDRVLAGKYARVWRRVFRRLAQEEGLRGRTAVDLAGGTGAAARYLASCGFQVTVVDASAAMLDQARRILPRSLTLRQDLRRLRLPEAVDLAVCAFGGMNYLPVRDLAKVFQRVREHLNAGGVFCFDAVTPLHLKRHYGGGVEVFQGPTHCSIWKHAWDPARRAAVIDLDGFERQGGSWRRHRPERHVHYSYTQSEWVRALRQAGFRKIRCVGVPSGERPAAGDSYWMFWAE